MKMMCVHCGMPLQSYQECPYCGWITSAPGVGYLYIDPIKQLYGKIAELENENDLLETIREAQGKMIMNLRNKLDLIGKGN